MRRPSLSPRRRRETHLHSLDEMALASPSNAFPVMGEIEGCVIAQFGDDVLGNILSKLPAKSFASAACVSRSWRSVCDHILSRPKLLSALSLKPSILEAADEVVKQVLSEPIRPHFAILYLRDEKYLEDAHKFVAMKLGLSTPLVSSEGFGFMGREASTGEFLEVFEASDEDDTVCEPLFEGGILLTVGYLPGLMVQLLHSRSSEKEPSSIETFVRDIRDCSVSVSGCPSPDAIILFGADRYDMKPVLHTLDNAFSEETIVVGNEATHFTWAGKRLQNAGLAAFIFAKDRHKSSGLGEIHFHLALSFGMDAVGPMFKAASVKTRNDENQTWLTGKREGSNEILDGDQILEGVADMTDKDISYIGVTKKRKYPVIGSDKMKPVTFREYHPIHAGDEEYLFVGGLDIKTGDLFQLYAPDVEVALSSTSQVSRDLKQLAMGIKAPEEVFGGFIFACCGRGQPFFKMRNVDWLPVLENFPGIPMAGAFTRGEICRGPLLASTSGEGNKKEASCGARCCSFVYSCVYLLLSFHPKPV